MKPELRLYWTSVEFNFMPTHEDANNAKGGMVYAFVEANDSRSALERITEELHSNKLEPFDFEFVKPYESEIWENKKDEKHFQTLADLAANSQDVVLDDFYIYERTE